MKLHSHYLCIWGFVGTILLTTPIIATARAKYNYIGIGATDEGFAVNAKIELAKQLSVRPTVLTDVEFDDDTEITAIAPITYDFESPFKNGKFLSFADAGLSGTTRDDGSVGLVVTGGMDYRASNKLTTNSSVIWLLFDDERVNFIVGLGFNF